MKTIQRYIWSEWQQNKNFEQDTLNEKHDHIDRSIVNDIFYWLHVFLNSMEVMLKFFKILNFSFECLEILPKSICQEFETILSLWWSVSVRAIGLSDVYKW